jgi:hypothetical protein
LALVLVRLGDVGSDSSVGIVVVADDPVLLFDFLVGGSLGGSGAPSVESGTIEVAGTSSSAIPAANVRDAVPPIAITAASATAAIAMRQTFSATTRRQPRAFV